LVLWVELKMPSSLSAAFVTLFEYRDITSEGLLRASSFKGLTRQGKN
jgi:hypothetical protein